MTINTVSATPDMIKDCILQLAKSPELRKMASWIHGPAGIGCAE
jgi:hypothetical protein